METLLLIPVDDSVVFPNMTVTLTVDVGDEERVLIVPRKDDEFASVGTVAEVAEHVRLPGGGHAVALSGLHRAIAGAAHSSPSGELRVEVTPHPDDEPVDGKTRNLEREYRAVVEELLELRGDDGRIAAFLRSITEPGTLADTSGYSPDISYEDKVDLLETLDVTERLEKALELQKQRLTELQVRTQIREDVQSGADKQQREYFLRKQMESIRKELDEDDASVAEEYRTKIEESGMPDEVREQAEKELGRLERMGEQSGESSMIRTYLDWLIAVPWSEESDEVLDPVAAREVLDADHAGLEDVKDRIVEHIGVMKLRRDRGIDDATDRKSGAILTLIGPPGTGKTSIGESIARATGREFVRISLGGVRDEAEIRGHRRTYIGALPGRLVRALRDAKTMNPVIMLDEVDKVGNDWRGDPSAALLEVLDPAQNHSFRDHYLDVELDLSKVLFIATANVSETIPAPLLDRMEVVRFDGYTTEEKVAIARDYLWPRQRGRNGLREDEVTVDDAVLRTVVSEYTREAGVRNLERELGTVLRKTATKIAGGTAEAPVTIDTDAIRDALGQAEVLPGGRGAHCGAGRGDRAGVHAGRRRRAVHRGHLDEGQGRVGADRPAGRRDEGVGADRPLLRARPRGRRGRGGGLLREPRVPRARAGGRHPQGRPQRRGHHDHRAGVAAERAPGQAHGGHDRRGHAAGPRAADRRAQAEGAGRPRGGADRRDHPRAQPGRHRRGPGGGPRRDDLPPGDDNRRGAGTRAGAGAPAHRRPGVTDRQTG